MVEAEHNEKSYGPEISLLSGNINDQTILNDELGRKPFAKGIARLITSSPESECLVVGIEGVIRPL